MGSQSPAAQTAEGLTLRAAAGSVVPARSTGLVLQTTPRPPLSPPSAPEVSAGSAAVVEIQVVALWV